MRKRKSRPFGRRLLLPAFLLLAGVGAGGGYWYLSRPPATPAVAPVAAEPKQRREVTLYFGAPEGTYLLAQTRDIDYCLTDRDCLRAVTQALIDGPEGDLIPILPAPAVLLDATVDNGTAVLDFSRDLVSAHPGGSVPELLTVYGLADSVAVNFPHLRQVRILVEGQAVESLKGHVGLQEPVPADFGFARPPDKIGQGEKAAAGDRRPAGDGRGARKQ
jgi:hypothetical protein